MALSNKDDHKDNYKEIFENHKEISYEIKELTDEINHHDKTYYLKVNTTRKRFDNFNDAIELF